MLDVPGGLSGRTSGCADRNERDLWLGDPGFVAEDFLVNHDLASLLTKWLNDIRDCQSSNGDLLMCCPAHCRYYQAMLCWKSTYPTIVWHTYLDYDDKWVAEEHFEGVKGLVEFLRSKADNHVLLYGLGDHMELDRDTGKSSQAPKKTPLELTSIAYYYFDVWILSQLTTVLERASDHEEYTQLAESIKGAFNERFLDKESNQYGTGSQTSNAVSLHFAMVPPRQEQAVLDNLVDNILKKHEGHLAAGTIGANALEHALGQYGRADVMYEIATKTTCPSWGYTIANGATTVWESFEVNCHSLNMKQFGSTEVFFYRDIVGIGLTAPGFRRIKIQPQVVGNLTHGEASINTVRGPAAVRWQKDDRSLNLMAMIPVGSDAKVHVPKIGLQDVSVMEGDNLIWNASSFNEGAVGIRGGSENEKYVIFDVGSGRYEFQLSAGP